MLAEIPAGHADAWLAMGGAVAGPTSGSIEIDVFHGVGGRTSLACGR